MIPEPDPRAFALQELSAAGDALAVGGIQASELARRFGTPLYAFDGQALRRRLRDVQSAFGGRVQVLYALKANPSLAVTAVLRAAGAGGDVASAGEIAIALAAGLRGDQLQFAGPGKTAGDLRPALAQRVLVNLESASEYERLLGLAGSVRPRVAIRVNLGAGGGRLKMAGSGKKFGVDAAEVPALAGRIAREQRADLTGLHCYLGTQNFDAAGWVQSARELWRLAGEVEAGTGAPLRSLNFGGGFGVPCFAGDPQFDLSAAGRGLQQLLASRPERTACIELGRYLVAPAGVYLTRVTTMKRSGGKLHAIVDGGLHQHGAAAGSGAVIRRAFPIVRCDALRATPAAEPCTVGGPLCTPADELGADLPLPQLREGDLLAVLMSGAYGLTYSSTLFLSHPTPAEVLVEGGEAWIARAAGTPEDALRGQSLPPGLR